MANKYPWTRWFYWREELKRLKQTTLATYFKFLDDYKIPPEQKGIYNAQDSVIKYANWSETLLLDLAYLPSDPLYTRFGSLELTWGYIDESAEVAEQCISILSTRVWRQRNEEYNLSPKILEGFNPDKWHVYRRYYKPDKDGTMPEYRKFIKALATDNKRLPKSYISQLEKTNEVTKQRLLYWNFDYDDTPWRLFEYDKLLAMQKNEPFYWEKFISCDPAREWRDTTRIVVWNGLTIEQVITEDKSNLKDLKDRLLLLSRREWVKKNHIIIDENWLWWWLVDELECQWFINNRRAIDPKIQSTPTSSLKKANFWMLKDQCYYLLSQYVNAWKISYKWPSEVFSMLVEELDIIVQIDIDKDWPYRILPKDEMKVKLWRSPDIWDAVMMRMFYEIRKPIDLTWLEATSFDTDLHPYSYKKEEVAFSFEIDDKVY